MSAKRGAKDVREARVLFECKGIRRCYGGLGVDHMGARPISQGGS